MRSVMALSTKREMNNYCRTARPAAAGGRLVFHLFAALAEFERDLIRDRTNAGLLAVRPRGRTGGRPKGVNLVKQKAALALQKHPTHSIREICQIVGISRNTYYKYIARAQEAHPSKRTSRRQT